MGLQHLPAGDAPHSQRGRIRHQRARAHARAGEESMAAESTEWHEEQEARLDLIDLIPELNAALVGDTEHLRELAWSVG